VLDPGTLARAGSGCWRSIFLKSEAVWWLQAHARGGVLTMGSGGRQEEACAWTGRSGRAFQRGSGLGRTGRSRGFEPDGGRAGIWGLELDGAGEGYGA
jgi:hypothetical protein